MSELNSWNQAPPPPPPPPPPVQPQTFDFGRPFTFVFQDPRWVSKILIGGLFMLGIVILIGPLFAMGYCARLVRNVVAGQSRPLPEWDTLGDYFAEGFRIFLIGFIYTIPVIAVTGFFVVPAIVAGALANNHDALREVQGIMGGFASCLIAPLSLLISFWLPGALLFAIVEQRFGAAFDFDRIWAFIRDNLGNYLLAFVIYFISRFIAGLGLILCCIGIIFTIFWQMLITSYAYAETWRLKRS
ncbi:MAG: hypothetical protein JWN02_742 [Acidobacteria bacterium]|nr:hypothetical protein [Acidobacteriota bacterium]